MWAQRKNLVSLTINLEDCKDPVIKIEPTKVYFKGTGGPDKKAYEVSIDLFGEIDTEVCLQIFNHPTTYNTKIKCQIITGNQILCQGTEHRVLPAKEGRGTLLAFHLQG